MKSTPIMLMSAFLAWISVCTPLSAQYRFQDDAAPHVISLVAFAEIFDAGKQPLEIEALVRFADNYPFLPVEGERPSLGFSDHHFWIRIRVVNDSPIPQKYYLEAGRPTTNRVDLYLIDETGSIQVLRNGDTQPFEEKSFPHRKILFPLEFAPNHAYEIFIHCKSEGELIELPLTLRSNFDLIQQSYFEQLVFGFFYGILFLAVITYLFFFFALKDMSFLYYCLYVSSGGLFQFSADGYMYQYMMPQGGWLGQYPLILLSYLMTFFLVRYAQAFLYISEYAKWINRILNGINILLAGMFFMILILPAALPASNPVINVLGLAATLMILFTVITFYVKGYPIDRFFSIGISVLVGSLVVYVMTNVGVLPHTFFTENSIKFGTGLEIIFLSLSMGNRIRILKSEKEKMQALALKKSEEMNELKSYFLSNMSHELRTPLNAIMGIAGLMVKEVKDAWIRRNCEVIQYASVGLLSSVNDILDFSKIQKGELRLENMPFEPLSVLEQISSNAAQNAAEKGLVYEFKKPPLPVPRLLGDPVRLGQIVNNVLGNAIKFTPAGRVLFEVDTSVDGSGNLTLMLTIVDTGVGIPADKLETIFESLTQENITHKRRFGGFGLGLFITRTLVDLHGGDIHLTSKQGTGTTCTIRLSYKIQQPEKQPEMIFPQDAPDLLGARVLVVEDNLINQMVMRAILRKWKHTEFLFANNGEEALAVLKENTMDVVLMDLQMPVMDGYEATLAIRNGEAGTHNSSLPILAITADVTEGSRSHALSIGINDYLTKPLDPETLYKKVTQTLSIERERASRLASPS